MPHRWYYVYTKITPVLITVSIWSTESWCSVLLTMFGFVVFFFFPPLFMSSLQNRAQRKMICFCVNLHNRWLWLIPIFQFQNAIVLFTTGMHQLLNSQPYEIYEETSVESSVAVRSNSSYCTPSSSSSSSVPCVKLLHFFPTFLSFVFFSTQCKIADSLCNTKLSCRAKTELSALKLVKQQLKQKWLKWSQSIRIRSVYNRWKSRNEKMNRRKRNLNKIK